MTSGPAGGRGLLVVISGPSGVGKDTLVKKLLAADPNLRYSVSYTTRPPRAYEVQGEHYRFVDEAQFARLVEAGHFLEHARYNTYCYGTSLKATEAALSKGQDVILKIDVQGAEQVQRRCPDATFIFISPPSLEELIRRRAGRASETEQEMAARQALAEREMSFAGRYDHVVVNDDVDRAAAEVIDLIRHRRGRMPV